jgi:hypothetical protein
MDRLETGYSRSAKGMILKFGDSIFQSSPRHRKREMGAFRHPYRIGSGDAFGGIVDREDPYPQKDPQMERRYNQL